MHRRDTVDICINKLETIFGDHVVLNHAERLVSLALLTKDHASLKAYMDKVSKLDKERVYCMVAAENYAGRVPPQRVYE